jgi:uncharacterized phage protein gp47/JayE
MPLTIRPKEQLLEVIISHLLAGDVITDIGRLSVIRQLCEGVASTQADLEYDLYNLQKTFYLTTAEGVDLDIRGRDHGLTRDAGQAASDPVTFSALPTYVDDIPIPDQFVVQATLADGTDILYRTLGDQRLLPSGRSVSGVAPSTTLTGGTNDRVALILDGDSLRTIVLGTQTTAVGIASALQAAVRALTASSPSLQSAYNNFRCDYSVTTPGVYTLRSGTSGPTSSCVVMPATSADASVPLKLGLAHGGQEQAGMTSLAVPVICDQVGVLGNVGAGQINQMGSTPAGIDQVANPLMFSNGREPASDDAYRQDIRAYLRALGKGTKDAIEWAVAHTVSPDGQQHVMSSQVVYGASTIQVFVCDGRSLTVGAQSDVIQAVQDELDGLGQEPGGFEPSGNVAGVAAATVLTVPIAVTVLLGPTPDLVVAQQEFQSALYQMLYSWPVGASLSYSQLTVKINETVVEVIDNAFTQPVAFSSNPPILVGGAIGQKIMPGTITVTVMRA